MTAPLYIGNPMNIRQSWERDSRHELPQMERINTHGERKKT